MGEIATVTVHIKKIRKKTENANVKSGYIETSGDQVIVLELLMSDVSGRVGKVLEMPFDFKNLNKYIMWQHKRLK